MQNKHNLVWLASYPKSGNTWFRIFLTNLLNESNDSLNINNMHATPIASARGLFDETLLVESADLTDDEIDLMRPELYYDIANNVKGDELSYHKIHDAFTKNGNGDFIFPPEVAYGVIYFIRNPLDVAVSFSHHSASKLDKTIKNMNNSENAFANNTNKHNRQLRQWLLTWSEHVLSWKNSPLDICIMRYEDMKLDSFKTFKKAVDFLKLDKSDDEIRNAIEMSDFNKIKQLELENGFHEKPQKADSFFRKGQVGDWRNNLNKEQVQRLINCHAEVMTEFGYLKGGEPIF